MSAIELCRTATLGGHVERCDACGHQRIAYNSCRNRHCPKCQSLARAQWLEARQAELLPTEYFHVVFTVPEPIAHRLSKQACALQHALPRQCRNPTHDRRRPPTLRRRDRLHRHSAHVGAEPAASSSRALRGPGRRHLRRRLALGRLPPRLLLARARTLAAVPPAVPAAAAPSLCRGQAAFLRRARAPP